MAREFKVKTLDGQRHTIGDELAEFVSRSRKVFRNISHLRDEAKNNPFKPKWTLGSKRTESQLLVGGGQLEARSA